MGPNIKISIVDNVWTKQMVFVSPGDVMKGHRHTFSHQTLLALGRFEISVEGVKHEYTAPQILKIVKNKEHEIKALTAGSIAYCIHPLRDGEGVEDIADPENIPAEYTPLVRP